MHVSLLLLSRGGGPRARLRQQAHKATELVVVDVVGGVAVKQRDHARAVLRAHLPPLSSMGQARTRVIG